MQSHLVFLATPLTHCNESTYSCNVFLDWPSAADDKLTLTATYHTQSYQLLNAPRSRHGGE